MDIQNNSITLDEDIKIHSVILKPNCYDWGDITKFRKTKAVQVTAFTLPKDKKLTGGDNSYVPQSKEIKFHLKIGLYFSQSASSNPKLFNHLFILIMQSSTTFFMPVML